MEKSRRTPRVALLGEFSAGKSTLANILLGRAQSPVRATATQMPTLWYRFGSGPPKRICEDGSEEVLVDRADISAPVDGTRAIEMSLDVPILQRFDLLDLPGSSDPNMAADSWDSILPEVDIAIWCTPATQAWRQSEAAVWESLPSRLQQRSLLLLTRIDKVAPPDRARVLRRVRAETSDQFRHVLPVALLAATMPPDSCSASGLDKVFDALHDVIEHEIPQPVLKPEPVASVSATRTNATVIPRRVASLSGMPRVRRVQPERRPL